MVATLVKLPDRSAFQASTCCIAELKHEESDRSCEPSHGKGIRCIEEASRFGKGPGQGSGSKLSQPTEKLEAVMGAEAHCSIDCIIYAI